MIIDKKLEGRVTLFAGDMRKIAIEDMQGDILISELFGSFGDNELSPECLIPTENSLRGRYLYAILSY
jgi:protein arginine N-methyltransferase 5